MNRGRAARPGPVRLTGAVLVAAVLGVALLLPDHRPAALAAWLAASWFWLGTAMGAAVTQRVHILTGGRWGRLLAPALRRLRAPIVPLVIAIALPLVLGRASLWPWAVDLSHAHGDLQRAWFSPTFAFARSVAEAGAVIAVVRVSRRPGRKGAAALGLVASVLLTTVLAADLLMALIPGWSSTAFGWITAAGQWGAAAACATAVVARHPGRAGRLLDPPASGGAPAVPVLRDLGNLLLMLVGLEVYLQFMQFLIIWAEDLPRETAWYLPRMQGAWALVSVAVIVLGAVLPIGALLWRVNKDRARRLAMLATGLVVAQALVAVWMVVPSIAAARDDATSLGLLPAALVGLGALLHGGSGGRGHRREHSGAGDPQAGLPTSATVEGAA